MELDSGPAVMRIPYEIFREIIIYMFTYTPGSGEFTERRFIPPLVPLMPPISASHVCRSWRYALLSDPTLWTLIIIPHVKPDLIMELLRRSKSALLTVFLKFNRSTSRRLGSDDTSNMLSSVFQQIHRFKTLHMYIYFDRLPNPLDPLETSVKQVLSYFQRPAPELQTLSSSLYLFTDLPLKQTFLDAFFSINAPNIKRILNHQLSPDFRELYCPSFHGLLKLDLTIPDLTDIDFCLFLNFLELSPCLQVLHILTEWSSKFIWPFIGNPVPRRVHLPHMQRLVLQAHRTTELMDLILSYIIFPSTLTWNITSLHLPEFAHWPPLVQLLSRAQFMFLYIAFSDFGGEFVKLTFKEKRGSESEYLNRLSYLYDDMSNMADLWNPLMRSISSTSITHLRLVFDTSLECISFSKILISLQSLESLSIEAGIKETYLSCLSTLTPNSEQLAASEYNMGNILASDTRPAQDPALDTVPINGPEDMKSFPNNSETSVFPCFYLRELCIDLKVIPLDQLLACTVRTCCDRRWEEGYPLQLLVKCPEIIWEDIRPILRLRESVKSILPLRLREDGPIHVEVRQRH